MLEPAAGNHIAVPGAYTVKDHTGRSWMTVQGHIPAHFNTAPCLESPVTHIPRSDMKDHSVQRAVILKEPCCMQPRLSQRSIRFRPFRLCQTVQSTMGLRSNET